MIMDFLLKNQQKFEESCIFTKPSLLPREKLFKNERRATRAKAKNYSKDSNL